MLPIALTGIVFLIGLVVSSLCTPFIMRKMREAGIVGVDIHKPSKPVIPEMGGISILVGLTATVILSAIALPSFSTEFLVEFHKVFLFF